MNHFTIDCHAPPNQALQRFDGFGKPGEGFPGGKGLVPNQTELAGASEPTVPRRARRGCHRRVPVRRVAVWGNGG